MTIDQIFREIEEQLALRTRARLDLAEQASSIGDRWSTEIHKGRAEELHQFGLWLAERFHLLVEAATETPGSDAVPPSSAVVGKPSGA